MASHGTAGKSRGTNRSLKMALLFSLTSEATMVQLKGATIRLRIDPPGSEIMPYIEGVQLCHRLLNLKKPFLGRFQGLRKGYIQFVFE
jgi:hypothetical protein